MLIWRITTGTAIVALVAGLCWLDYRSARPGVYLLPLAVLLSLAVVRELLAMFRLRDVKPIAWVVYGGTLVVVLASAVPMLWETYPVNGPVGRLGWLALGVMVALLLAVVGELLRYEQPGSITANLTHSIFAVLYAGGLMGMVIQLRILGGEPWGDDGRWGMLALVSLVATVKMSDIGQYTIGNLFGKHKLAPAISPGKTWEGAVGGVAFALLAISLVVWLGRGMVAPFHDDSARLWWRSALGCLTFAVAVAVAGVVGDLTASLLKRDAGIKDSGNWLPGYGGAVDLLDSLLGAAPVAYILWVLGVIGP